MESGPSALVLSDQPLTAATLIISGSGQFIQQRLSLLWTYVYPLKILNCNVIRGGLGDAAEQKQEVPQIHTYLDAISVVLTVIGCIAELDFGTHRLRHIWLSVTFGLPVTSPLPASRL